MRFSLSFVCEWDPIVCLENVHRPSKRQAPKQHLCDVLSCAASRLDFLNTALKYDGQEQDNIWQSYPREKCVPFRAVVFIYIFRTKPCLRFSKMRNQISSRPQVHPCSLTNQKRRGRHLSGARLPASLVACLYTDTTDAGFWHDASNFYKEPISFQFLHLSPKHIFYV